MGSLAAEVVGLHGATVKPRLDDVVLGSEIATVGAIALLEPGRRQVDAETDRDHSKRFTPLIKDVPCALAKVCRDVEFPAGLADIRDSRSKYLDVAKLDRSARAEAKGVARHVIGRDRADKCAGLRPPDANRRPG